MTWYPVALMCALVLFACSPKTTSPKSIVDLLTDMDADLDDHSPSRMQAILSTGNEIIDRGNEAVPELLAVLSDPAKANLHPNAIIYLAKTNDPRLIAPFRNIFKDGTTDERNAAFLALHANPIPELFEDVFSVAKRQLVLNGLAFRTLGVYKDKRALPFLRANLEALPSTRGSAMNASFLIEALGKIGDPIALPDVKRFKKSLDHNVLIAVAIAEKSLDPHFDQAATVARMQKFVADPEWLVRLDGANALVSLNAPEAGPTWLALTKDPEPTIRGFAAESLSKMKYEPARPSIEALLSDSDEFVRLSATKALADMGKIKD